MWDITQTSFDKYNNYTNHDIPASTDISTRFHSVGFLEEVDYLVTLFLSKHIDKPSAVNRFCIFRTNRSRIKLCKLH